MSSLKGFFRRKKRILFKSNVKGSENATFDPVADESRRDEVYFKLNKYGVLLAETWEAYQSASDTSVYEFHCLRKQFVGLLKDCRTGDDEVPVCLIMAFASHVQELVDQVDEGSTSSCAAANEAIEQINHTFEALEIMARSKVNRRLLCVTAIIESIVSLLRTVSSSLSALSVNMSVTARQDADVDADAGHNNGLDLRLTTLEHIGKFLHHFTKICPESPVIDARAPLSTSDVIELFYHGHINWPGPDPIDLSLSASAQSKSASYPERRGSFTKGLNVVSAVAMALKGLSFSLHQPMIGATYCIFSVQQTLLRVIGFIIQHDKDEARLVVCGCVDAIMAYLEFPEALCVPEERISWDSDHHQPTPAQPPNCATHVYNPYHDGGVCNQDSTATGEVQQRPDEKGAHEITNSQDTETRSDSAGGDVGDGGEANGESKVSATSHSDVQGGSVSLSTIQVNEESASITAKMESHINGSEPTSPEPQSTKMQISEIGGDEDNAGNVSSATSPTTQGDSLVCPPERLQSMFTDIPYAKLTHYFTIQAQALELVDMLILLHPRSLECLSQHKLSSKMIDMAVWVAIYFSKFSLTQILACVKPSCQCSPHPEGEGNALLDDDEAIAMAIFKKSPSPTKLGPPPVLIDAGHGPQIGAFVSCLTRICSKAPHVREYAAKCEKHLLQSIGRVMGSSNRVSHPVMMSATAEVSYRTRDLDSLRSLAGELDVLPLKIFTDVPNHDDTSKTGISSARYVLRCICELQIFFLDSIFQVLCEMAGDNIVNHSHITNYHHQAGGEGPLMEINVLIEAGLYEVLFGSLFYFLKEIKVDGDEGMTHQILYLQKLIKECIMYIIKFVSTKLIFRDNTPEIKCLLGVLAAYIDVPEVVSDICTTIQFILHYNKQTLPVLLSLDGIPLLCRCYQRQTAKLESLKGTEKAKACSSARNSVLNVLDKLLEETTIQIQTIREVGEGSIANILLQGVKSQSVRKLCLDHLYTLLTCKRVSIECEEMRPLVGEFCGSLSRVGQDWTIADRVVLWEVLDTIQRVFHTLFDEEAAMLAEGEGTKAYQRRSNIQRLFRDEGEMFLRLANILHQPPPLPKVLIPCDAANYIPAYDFNHTNLCCHILATLAALLKRNARAKKDFGIQIGYHSLAALVIRCAKDTHPCLQKSLLAILIEEPYSPEAGDWTIHNENMLMAIFDILKPEPSTDKSEIEPLGKNWKDFFQTTTNVVGSSLHNLVKASTVPVMDTLVDMLMQCPSEDGERFEKCIQMLGSNNITVKQLKSLFLHLKDQTPEKRAELLPSLIRILANMVNRDGSSAVVHTLREGVSPAVKAHPNPRAFFNFDGLDSGIYLPTIKGWPSPRGYSFATWFRVESFDPTSLQKEATKTDDMYQPRLYSFISDEGYGFEAFFEDQYLTFRLYSEKHDNVHKLPYRFEPQTWYHIVVSQGCGKAIISRSEVRVMVNGQVFHKFHLKYPRMWDKEYNHSFIGTDRSGYKKETLCRNFHGQMTAFYLFDDSVGPQIASLMYDMGPNYMSCYGPADKDPMLQNAYNPDIGLLFDGHFQSKIFMTFNPMARDHRQLLNLSPANIQAGQPSTKSDPVRVDSSRMMSVTATAGSLAAALGGTIMCCNLSVVNVADCIGGLGVVMPLLRMLFDTGDLKMPPWQALWCDVDLNKSASVRVSCEAIPHLLHNLLSLLADMVWGQPVKQRQLLEAHGFPVLALFIAGLGQYLTPESVDSLFCLVDRCAANTQLFDQGLRCLILDASVWVKGDAEVQRRVATLLLNACITTGYTSQRVRHNRALQSIFESLRWFYMYGDFRKEAMAEHKFLQKLETVDIRFIRQTFLQTLVHVLGKDGHISITEATLLMSQVTHCPDPEQLQDLLGAVLELVHIKRAGLHYSISRLGGLDPFVTLLTNPSVIVRCLASHIIGFLVLKRKFRTSTSIQLSYGFCILYDALESFCFCVPTYMALRSVMLGDLTPRPDTMQKFSPLTLASKMDVRVPSAMHTILALSLKCGDNGMKLLVLKDLSVLVRNKVDAIDVLLRIEEWQDILIRILVTSNRASTLFEAIVDVFHHVFYASLIRLTNGWQCIENTLGYLQKYADQGQLDADDFMDSVLVRTVGSYLDDVRDGHMPKKTFTSNTIIQHNLAFLLTLIEDQICYNRFVMRAMARIHVANDNRGSTASSSSGCANSSIPSIQERVRDLHPHAYARPPRIRVPTSEPVSPTQSPMHSPSQSPMRSPDSDVGRDSPHPQLPDPLPPLPPSPLTPTESAPAILTVPPSPGKDGEETEDTGSARTASKSSCARSATESPERDLAPMHTDMILSFESPSESTTPRSELPSMGNAEATTPRSDLLSVGGTEMEETDDPSTDTPGTPTTPTPGDAPTGFGQQGQGKRQAIQERVWAKAEFGAKRAWLKQTATKLVKGTRASIIGMSPMLHDSEPLEFDEEQGVYRDQDGKWAHATLAERTMKLITVLDLCKVEDFGIDETFSFKLPDSQETRKCSLTRKGGVIRIAMKIIVYCFSYSGPNASWAQLGTASNGKANVSVEQVSLEPYLHVLHGIVLRDKDRESERERFEELLALSTVQRAREANPARCRTFDVLLCLTNAITVSEEMWDAHKLYFTKIFEIMQWVCRTRQDFLAAELHRLLETPALRLLLQKTTNVAYQQVQSVINSQEWQQALTRVFQPMVVQYQKEERHFWLEVYYRRQHVIAILGKSKALKGRDLDHYKTKIKKEKDRLIESPEYMKVVGYVAGKVDNHLKEIHRSGDRYWGALLKGLINERGPWAAKPASAVSICLNKHQQRNRIRIKTIRIEGATLTINRLAPEQPPEDTQGPQVTAGVSSLGKVKKTSDEDDEDEADEEQDEGAGEWTEVSVSHTGLDEIDLEPHDELVLIMDCEIVTPMQAFSGRVDLNMETLSWYLDEVNTSVLQAPLNAITEGLIQKQKPQDNRWQIGTIVDIAPRRHRLQRCALEIYFNGRSSVLFNFLTPAQCQKFWKALMTLKLRLLRVKPYFRPESNLKKSKITEKWQRREISNFDYLMQLNYFAGRTYNDLTQYPVFPWVLQDYDSEEINLKDPSVYRDLSQPIGVMGDPARKAEVVERYASMEGLQLEPFHYGSHYSTAGFVLYYLVRLEPFTSSSIILQGGKFDHADRMFDSMSQTWQGCMKNTSDVKELTPEFYYLPEMFINNNPIDLGQKQCGRQLGDVVLPPWAKGSPFEFIRIMREALESEHVSAHLDEWIDLIFGYKQRGSAAEEAINVFHPLTYEGNVDFDSLTDEVEKKSVIAQIDNFGQTPIQLFKKKHPKRDKLGDKILFNPFMDNTELMLPKTPYYPIAKDSPIICVRMLTGPGMPEKVITVTGHGAVNTHKITLQPPYTKAMVRTAFVAQAQIQQQQLVASQSSDRSKSPSTHEVREMVHSGLADSLKAPTSEFANQPPASTSTNQLQLPETLPGVADFVGSVVGMVGNDPTALLRKKRLSVWPFQFIPSGPEASTRPALGEGASMSDPPPYRFALAYHDRDVYLFATGLWDNSCQLCHINGNQLKVIQSLSLHKDLVTCVSISENQAYVVTGSKDTTCIVWTLHAGRDGICARYQRTLYGHDDEVVSVVVCTDMRSVASGSSDGTIILHSLSGRYERTIHHPARHRIDLLAISPLFGHIIYYSKADQMLHLVTINGVHIASVDACSNLFTLCLSSDSRFIVTGGSYRTSNDNSLVVRNMHDLSVVRRLCGTHCAVRSLALHQENQILVAGLEDGAIMFFAVVLPRFES